MTKTASISFRDDLLAYSKILRSDGTGKPSRGDLLTDLAELEKNSRTYKRPNGEVYRPRSIMVNSEKVHDVTFIKTAYEARMPALLFGVPGTGKTAMFEAALPDVVTIQGTVETETADFVGSWVQNPDSTFSWVDGPLTIACEQGRPFLVDEIALIDPRVMSLVYALMDGRDVLDITANPMRGQVKAQDGFVVFGACNPNVPGAVMSDALLSRFTIHVEVKTDWTIAAELKISPKIIQVARNLGIKADSGNLAAAPQLRELIAFKNVSAVFGEVFALNNFVSQARPEDRQLYVEAITPVFGTSNVQPLSF